MVWCTAPISRVCPSGLDLATKSAPSVAPAPGLLSTITVWPRLLDRRSARARASPSVVPPAGKGTTRLIGRCGPAAGAWALALPRPAAPSRAASARRRVVRWFGFMSVSPVAPLGVSVGRLWGFWRGRPGAPRALPRRRAVKRARAGAGDRVRRPPAGSLDEAELLADARQDRGLLLVEDGLVLRDQVVAVGVDADDQRAELAHPVDPQRLGHAQVLPLGALDGLDLGGGQHRAAAGEDRVHGLVFLAAGGGLGAHAALADDQLDAGLLDEGALELLHAHAGGRADADHLEVAVVLLAHDRAGVEDRAALEVHRQLASLLDQAAVGHVAAGHQAAGQPDHVAHLQVGQVFVADRGLQDLLRGVPGGVHSCTPSCERMSWLRSPLMRIFPRRCAQQPVLMATPMVEGWRADDSMFTPITLALPVRPCGPMPTSLRPCSSSCSISAARGLLLLESTGRRMASLDRRAAVSTDVDTPTPTSSGGQALTPRSVITSITNSATPS